MWSSFGVTARAPDPPVQVQWPSRNTTLVDKFHRAILSGKLNRIRDLYNKGVLIDASNEDGQTGLFCAAYKGCADVVALLLSLGAKPNARCQPEGYTPVHGACYFGCTQILKLLLQAGGDLRLCDSQRRTPMDWCRLQSDSAKIQSIVNIVEGARSCVTKTKGIDLLKGIQSSLSPRSNKAFVEMVKSFIRPSSRNRQDTLLNLEELSNGIHSTGFGKVYFGSGERCAAVIGLPYVSEVNDLQIEKDENVPSWACGKFTTFQPRQWTPRRTRVSIRELNKMAGNDCVPDILITELEIRSKLHHPNLLMLLGVCQTQKCDSVSLLYERIQLGSLYSILHDRRFSLSDKFKTEIVIQMCEALEYVHSLGVVHCALTSHAVILVNKRQAKLSCFEYALPDDTNSEEPRSWRHPILTSDAHLNILRHWMAPEVLIKQIFSVRGDIYSLACVMWELCHEEIPWHDFSLPTLRKLFLDTKETLSTNTPSKYWSHVLEIGLRVKEADRDLEIDEIIYMMNKNKQFMSIKNCEVESSFNGKTSGDSVIPSRQPFAGDTNLDAVDSNISKKLIKSIQRKVPSFRSNQEKSKKYCTTENASQSKTLPNRTCKTLPAHSSGPRVQGMIKKFAIKNSKSKATCTQEINTAKEAAATDQLKGNSSLSRNFKLQTQEKGTETGTTVKQRHRVEESVKLVRKRMKNDGTQTCTSTVKLRSEENSHRPVENVGTQADMTEKHSNFGQEFERKILDSSSSVVSSSTPTSSIPPDRSTNCSRANHFSDGRPQKNSQSNINDELNQIFSKRLLHVAEDRKFLSLQLPPKNDSKKLPSINPSIKPASHFIEGVQTTAVVSEPWNYIPMSEGDNCSSGAAIKPAGHALSHQTNGKNLAQKVKSYTAKLKRKFQLSFQDSLYAKYSTRRELSTEQLNHDDPVNIVNSRSTLDLSSLEHDERVCPVSQGFVYKTAKEFDAVFASQTLGSESKAYYYNKESQTGNLSSSFDGIKKNTRSVTSQCSLQLMSTVNQRSFLEGFESSVKSSNSVLHSTPGTGNDFRVTRLKNLLTSNCVVKDSEHFELGEGEPAASFLTQPPLSTTKLNCDSFTSHPINTQLDTAESSSSNNNNEEVTNEFSSGNSSSEYMYKREGIMIDTEAVDGGLGNPEQKSYIIQTGRRNSDIPKIRTGETDEEEVEDRIHSEELGEYDEDDEMVDENNSNDVKNSMSLGLTGNEHDLLLSPSFPDRACKHCLSNST